MMRWPKPSLSMRRWRTQQAALPSPVEEHFDQAIKEIKRMEEAPPPKMPEASYPGTKKSRRPARGQ